MDASPASRNHKLSPSHSAPPAATNPCFSLVHPVPNVIPYPSAALHMRPCCVSCFCSRSQNRLTPTCCIPIQNTRSPSSNPPCESRDTDGKDLLNRAVTPSPAHSMATSCHASRSPSPHVLRDVKLSFIQSNASSHPGNLHVAPPIPDRTSSWGIRIETIPESTSTCVYATPGTVPSSARSVLPQPSRP